VSRTSSAGYAALFHLPDAPAVFAASLVGRLSYSTVSLSLLLSVRTATGSYASAGLAAAAFGVTCAALAPLRARQVDRGGPRRALRFLAAGYVVALAPLAAACATQVTPPAALVVLSAAAGVFPPPLGPSCGDCGPSWRRSPRCDSVPTARTPPPEQVLYTVSPVISGLIVAVASGTCALGVTAALLAALVDQVGVGPAFLIAAGVPGLRSL